MMTLPEHLEQPFLHIAEMEHKPVSTLIEQALTEFLEDYYDARLAEQTLKEIERGEVKVFSLTEAWAMLDGLDN